MHPTLKIASQIARAIGTQLTREFDRLVQDPSQRKKNLVQFREYLETLATELIHKTYPEDIVEFVTLSSQQNKTVWLVDVLNGQNNFEHGIAHFAVCLVILQEGRPEHCLIYDPLIGETFSASRGKQAQLNQFRIRMRSYDAKQTPLIAGNYAHWGRLSLAPEQIYQTGSRALMIAYSSVRYDAFIGEDLSDVEVLAGQLLLKMAGAMVTDFAGGEAMSSRKELLSADAKLLRSLVKQMKR